jgi:hypothetical protein
MATEAIQVGDRVINLQVPGLFTVIDRSGQLLVIETAKGLRMRVLDSQVRLLDDVKLVNGSGGGDDDAS